MKSKIFLVMVALSLGMSAANAEAHSYRAPSHNFYQNNWMAGQGG